MSKGILDQEKHSAVTFKINSKTSDYSKSFKDREISDGLGIVRGRKKFSTNLRGRGSRFKLSGNTQVPLIESMEKMATLISNELANEISSRELNDMDSIGDIESHQ